MSRTYVFKNNPFVILIINYLNSLTLGCGGYNSHFHCVKIRLSAEFLHKKMKL